jgi:predicted transcriptional regulator
VNRDILMSIHPGYAEAILSGAKTVELRRRKPSFAAGSRVVVYSSSPSQQLLGVFEVAGVRAAAPEELWEAVSDEAGVTREAFDAYFAGCQVGYAIDVRSPKRLSPRRLRFRPPQSYLFLKPGLARHRAVLSWAVGS